MSDALIAYAKKLEATGFYGSVTFTLSKGRVILAETKQLLKPDTMKQITNQEEIPVMTPTTPTNNAEEFEVLDQRNPDPNWWVRTGTALTDLVVNTFTGGLRERQDVHPWNFVEGAAYKWLYKPDLQAARILYAAVAAHKLDGTPVWPMIVAPPGSVKTELLNALDGLPLMHILDSLTAQTFISGQIDDGTRKRIQDSSNPTGYRHTTKDSPSFLMRVGESGIVVFKDFSTILKMKADQKEKIFADMRRIFDGELKKEFGTTQDPQERKWTGRITFCAGCTPAIDEHTAIFQSLGERFVMVRWPRAGGVEAARAAITQNDRQLKADMKAAVHNLLEGRDQVKPVLPDEMITRIGALTEVGVVARTAVQWDYARREITGITQPESNTRLPQQLAALAKGAAYLDGHREVNEDDFALVKRVTLTPCLP